MFDDSISSQLTEIIRSKGYKIEEKEKISSVRNFSSIDDEVFSLYNGVGLRLNHSAAILELTGKDCVDFLHRITTNSILYIKEGELVKTIFTNEKGRIIGLADVLKFEDKLWLKTDTFFKERIVAWINRYVISDDVNVKDKSNDYFVIDFYGLQRNTFLEWIFNSSNMSVNPDHFYKITYDDFELYSLSYSDPLSSHFISLIVPVSQLPNLLKLILENKGPYDLNLVGSLALESYRVEQGIPSPGNELNDNFNPHELNISELIDTKKGCYIGQEVLARLETYDKVQKRIIGLEFSEDFELNENTELKSVEDEVAGIVTSKVFSYKLRKVIGLGVVRNKYRNSDFNLFVGENNKVLVNTISLPFIKVPK
jgi:folate-binding protein YgfZ